jgi:L-malate glycosyltransferase
MRVLWIASAAENAARARPDLELARALAAQGVELHLVAPDGPLAQGFSAAGFNWAGPLPRRWLGRAAMSWLREGCQAAGIEVVHLLDPIAAIAALPALESLRAAVVLRHSRPGGVHKWNPLSRMSVLNRGIDVVACRCEAARTELARYRDPANLYLLPPACSPEWLEGPPAKLEKLGLPRDAFPVAVIGDYSPRKGVEYVVEAAQWLPAQAPVHFLLLGSGLENRVVLERVARSPWRRNFHLLGHREDAPAILAACAVSVRGAIRREGLPQSVLESMALGVPPIVTDAGGLPELVVQGESGIIVARRNARAIGEALTWLLEHPEARRAMGQAARERIAREFPPERAVASHLELYRALRAGLAI